MLELRGIGKRFGSVEALRGVDFFLAPGEIHGLLGENGAGKSTLMHVAFGLVRPDEGAIEVGGAETTIRTPLEARALGIGMVHQHFTSIPTLTVRENLTLAGGSKRRPRREQSRAAARLRAALLEGLDPAALVESLTAGQKQRLEIGQALATDARILLLDEPTAVLTPGEVTQLLQLLREFAKAGGSVVFITHKLGEVFEATDRVTVLRRGQVTLTGPIQEQTRGTLAAAMIGPGVPASPRERGPLSDAAGPVRARWRGFVVRAGEIVGIAAVEGNGQRALLRAMARVDPRPPDMEVDAPVAFIPEDRTSEGVIPGFTLTENLVLGLGDDPRWGEGPWLRWAVARRRTAALLEEFDIRAAGPDALARTLSGGNQQRLIFARALEGEPALVVAENPTRGLDLRATAFVHDRLVRLAAGGAAVVLYSTDLDELVTVASRVVVMRRGEPLPVPAGATREEVGAMMVGARG